MTRQRKIYGAVLALAASAFGVDRLWLGPDPAGTAGAPSAVQTTAQTAQADPPAPQVPGKRRGRGGLAHTPKSAAGAAPQAPDGPPQPRPLAVRLLEAAGAEQIVQDTGDGPAAVADAFKPSDLWYPAPAAPVAAPARPAVAPERVEEFRARHRLTAVLRTPRGGMALIGGKVYAPGQAIDGFTLDSIGERTAVLRRGEATVELKIDPPGALSSLSGE